MFPENRSTLLTPRRISKGLRRVGFAEELIPLMTSIALAESSGYPHAHNRNQSTGDDSYGLLQINMIGDIGVERRQLFGLNSNGDLFNPRTNFEAAKWIFDQQGLKAWGAYRNGSYRDHLALLMADKSYFQREQGMSQLPKFVLFASNVAAHVNRQDFLAFRFAANKTSSMFISEAFQSDRLIAGTMPQRLEHQVWNELLGGRDKKHIGNDFMISLFIEKSPKSSVSGKENFSFNQFGKKDGYFYIQIDEMPDSLYALQRRLDEELTLQGNILLVIDDYNGDCGSNFMVSALEI